MKTKDMLRTTPLLLAVGTMLVSLPLGVAAMRHQVRPFTGCSYAGVGCNIAGYCNFNGINTNRPGCGCDIQNFCESIE